MSDERGNYNEALSWALDADEKRCGREWLGYGSLDAPHWFIGLEPGGDYDPEFARFWIESLAAAPVFDPRRDARIEANPWFLPTTHVQETWGPLIETVFGFTGSTPDVLDYQLHRFGCAPPVGELAILELSAFAAKGLGTPSPHRFTFLEERVVALRKALTSGEKSPLTAVFYGTTQRAAFGDVVGGFDANGFKRVGQTLCVLVRHPKARGARQDWRKLGRDLRYRVENGLNFDSSTDVPL